MNKVKEVDVREFLAGNKTKVKKIKQAQNRVKTKVYDFSSIDLNTEKKLELFQISMSRITLDYRQAYHLGMDLIENNLDELDEKTLKIVMDGLKTIKGICDYAFESIEAAPDVNISVAAFFYGVGGIGKMKKILEEYDKDLNN